MNNNDNVAAAFSKLALTLANDYKQIFVIDPKTNHYLQYSSSEYTKEVYLRTTGEDFFANLNEHFLNYVCKNDKEKLSEALEKENLMKELEAGHSVNLKCGLIFNFEIRYYFVKAIMNNDGSIIIGVLDADEQIRRKKADDEAIATYSEIADSLAKMFEVIYHIDTVTGHYTEYSSSASYAKLGLQQNGENFFEKMKTDIPQIVHPDDCDMVLSELDKHVLLSNLKERGSVSITYRQLLDGKTKYVKLLAYIPKNDTNNIVICVRNIDSQKRTENISETYRHIAGSLAGRYEVVYYIDIDNNNYIELNAHNRSKLTITKERDDFFEDLPVEVEKYIYEEDRRKVMSELMKDTLLSNISKKGTVSLTYRQIINGRPQYVNLLAARNKDDPQHVSIGVVNVDEQMRRELKITEEIRKFNDIAMALAQRYEVIYHVNINTNDYAEYTASEKYAKLRIGSKGSDFFAECQKNIQKDIYPEDRPMMSKAVTKENILENVRETGKFYLNYRLMLDGRPQYVTLFIVRPKEDSTHIILALANVDAVRKKELDFEMKLGSAMDMANRDPLTGIKNKRAYAQAETELDEQISKASAPPFAVTVCDINGLKQVNDKHGHNAGDEYIKAATKLICENFKHSPVFRIGGDEFAVLLKGSDFEKRKELMKNLSELQKGNREQGLVTVSYGYSDFDPEMDLHVQDVFERADTAMYSNKRMFKAGYDFSGETNSELERTIKFYELYAHLVSAMTDEDIDIKKIESILIEISLMFRLSKAVTRIYRNSADEKKGEGETLKCYDTGVEGKEILSVRTVTSLNSIGTIKAYMSDDVAPLTDDEKWKVNLVMRTTLSFVSRNRLRDMLEEIAYFDDDGYRNFRSMINYFINNDLKKKVAFHYNLLHFSLINQDIGRTNGDIVMKNHFEGLEKLMGDLGSICRLGGDNFVGMCDASISDKVIEYLTKTNVPYNENSSVSISTSVGVVCFPEDFIIYKPEAVMGKLMIAARAAQSSKTEHIIYYNEALVKVREKAKKVQQLFPEALANNEFKVYYQPKVDTFTGELSGAEALCRWFREGTVVPPGDFAPVLEETTDICKLDFFMLEQVCKDIRDWLDKGMDVKRISVNFSRRHMTDTMLIQSITEIIDRYEIPHSYIEIELTETTTDVGFSDLKRVVSELRENDIYTSVDDFGVGYSSLNLICDIPWNVLKIDKSILPAEGNDSSTRSMMFKHVVAMAKQFGLSCIAEGVETKEQLEILRENSCDYAQGFLFDRPMPKEEFEKRMASPNYTV